MSGMTSALRPTSAHRSVALAILAMIAMAAASLVAATPTQAMGETCGGLAATVRIGLGEQPTSGPDVIIGTSGSDVVNGLGGNDVICGLGGEDNLRGGSGRDRIFGGDGGDLIYGGGGIDRLFGGSGHDLLIGGKGKDRATGGPGADDCVSTLQRSGCELVNGRTRIFTMNRALGTGVNLGNMLEAPREGDWGLNIEADYFDLISDAGFRHVRAPIRWSAYADEEAPYTIADGVDPTIGHPDYTNIWQRVDWIIEQADRTGLIVIIDLHHYYELSEDPAGHRDRFLALWEQIAPRYQDAGPHVVFELNNEPEGQFNENPAVWYDMFADALDIVRETNPTRAVLAAPAFWNAIAALDGMPLPNDKNLIVSVHFYDPFPFTHQGAEWSDPILPTPTPWNPETLGISGFWQDQSWGLSTASTGSTLSVTFEDQWTGLQFERGQAFEADTLSFEVRGSAELVIECRPFLGDPTTVTTLTTSAGLNTYEVDMSACPSDATGFWLMNAGTTWDVLRFRSLELCSNLGCEQVLTDSAGAIGEALDYAAQWGSDRGVPMNVGEYGAYDANGAAPFDDRVAWTATVQSLARQNAMSTTYWEFAGGFGIYDPEAGEWRESLLDAIISND